MLGNYDNAFYHFTAAIGSILTVRIKPFKNLNIINVEIFAVQDC